MWSATWQIRFLGTCHVPSNSQPVFLLKPGGVYWTNRHATMWSGWMRRIFNDWISVTAPHNGFTHRMMVGPRVWRHDKNMCWWLIDGPTCVERFSPQKNKVGKGKEDQFTSIPRRSMYGMFSYMKTKKYIKLSLYKDPFGLVLRIRDFPQKSYGSMGNLDVSTINPTMHRSRSYGGISPEVPVTRMTSLPRRWALENQLYTKWSETSYNYNPYPWTPKPWKMKVLNPQSIYGL